MHIQIMEENESLLSETSTFCKWLRQSYPQVKLSIPINKTRCQLNDHSLLLPLVHVASSPDLVAYLNLAIEYINFRFRGALESDVNVVEVKATVSRGQNEELRQFHFKGTANDYVKTVEKFDPNAFFNRD